VPDGEDRLGELRRLAESRQAWRADRRIVVREFAHRLDTGEVAAELRAGQDDDDTTVVLVTDRRVLIGRCTSLSQAVVVESIELGEVISVQIGAQVAGQLDLVWSGGRIEIRRMSVRDAEVLHAAIHQRLRSRQRAATRRRERKPYTELEMLESLRRSGVLTDAEFVKVRSRVLQEIANKFGDDGTVNAPPSTPAPGTARTRAPGRDLPA